MALLRLRKKALDQSSFADAGFTADESNAPLAADGLMQLCVEDGQFAITFEQCSCHSDPSSSLE